MSKQPEIAAPEKLSEAVSKIETIKNLIFGDDIATYNSEFENLKKDIRMRKKELEEFIEDTRKELIQTIDNLHTDINIRMTELEDKIQEHSDNLEYKKVDKKEIGSLLINLGEKIAK
ncbi:fructose 1,6-bisphosphatase [Aquimarina sp. ERC-38]|uniref:fructose 1,6-bisphosphatase n=1 Tax=Aquimarina sp. ERC-38 TaxID=2949996 RepID=UPI00224823ED|nr:fructose 1,6-bisphosphatase [Aquimarina sp. ERC-38]UZO81957.1 fructose 1,6-bisphosphatase [Aquimarina sp. ERC-38]